MSDQSIYACRKRAEQTAQTLQTIAHVKQITSALLTYCEALNVTLEITVRVGGSPQVIDYSALCAENHPDEVITLKRIRDAVEALLSIGDLTLYPAWPDFVQQNMGRAYDVESGENPEVTL